MQNVAGEEFLSFCMRAGTTGSNAHVWKRNGQIQDKVIRSSSHNAENKNIRKGKGRQPVERMKHLSVILQSKWQYLGQKDLGEIKAAAR